MTMTAWAEQEVELAKKANHNGDNEGEMSWDSYIDDCYDSALKAYKCLSEDGHSGMSWNITARILTDLMREVPLTPIEEDDESIWSSQTCLGDQNHWQCTRRFSLFRDKNSDGTYSYHDIDLVIVQDVFPNMDKPGYHLSGCHSRIGDLVCEMMFGNLIKFPYMPPREPYRVRRIEMDHVKHGSDIFYIDFVKKPNGEKIEVAKFFRDVGGKLEVVGEEGMNAEFNESEMGKFDEMLKFSDSKR
jgi:hypothetical protein